MSNIKTPVTQVDADPQFSLGYIAWSANGNAYRYVKALDAVTYKAGQLAEWADATLNYVTNDRAGGSAIGTQTAPAGLVMGIPTSSKPYGWIQVAGIGLCEGDGSVAAGEAVVSHSVDGQADTMAAGEEHQVFGVALDADSTSNDPLATSALFHVRLRGLV